MYATDRWEQGSFFALPDLTARADNREHSCAAALGGAVLVGSGRVALTLLLAHGQRVHGWRRVLIPTYYCEEVVRSLSGIGTIKIARYNCGPLDSERFPRTEPGDVVLRVDYFGWGTVGEPLTAGVAVIEDRSHDPLRCAAPAGGYAFASLRKTLPLPDGGAIWLPKEETLDSAPTECAMHDEAVALRLAAMAIKRSYLHGGAGEKQVARALDAAAEEILRRGRPARMSVTSELLLTVLNAEPMARARRENLLTLRSFLGDVPDAEVLGPEFVERPLALLLRISTTARREALRGELIARRIYPAVLWPVAKQQEQWLRPEDVDFSERTLVVHVDSRYGAGDMHRVAMAIHEIMSTQPRGRAQKQ